MSPAVLGCIDAHGTSVQVNGKVYFLPHAEHPWFRDAAVGEIIDVELLHGTHLH